MFWKSKPKDTLIAESTFRFTLPGMWIQEPSSAPTRWSYHSSNQDQQLTVSLFGFTPATVDEKSGFSESWWKCIGGFRQRCPTAQWE